jgi:hypothetical protein
MDQELFDTLDKIVKLCDDHWDDDVTGPLNDPADVLGAISTIAWQAREKAKQC